MQSKDQRKNKLKLAKIKQIYAEYNTQVIHKFRVLEYFLQSFRSASNLRLGPNPAACYSYSKNAHAIHMYKNYHE